MQESTGNLSPIGRNGYVRNIPDGCAAKQRERREFNYARSPTGTQEYPKCSGRNRWYPNEHPGIPMTKKFSRGLQTAKSADRGANAQLPPYVDLTATKPISGLFADLGLDFQGRPVKEKGAIPRTDCQSGVNRFEHMDARLLRDIGLEEFSVRRAPMLSRRRDEDEPGVFVSGLIACLLLVAVACLYGTLFSAIHLVDVTQWLSR